MFVQDSIVLISSQDEKNKRFGTGFIIRQSGSRTHVLTCAHVVEDLGGCTRVNIDGMPASVVAIGEVDCLDLAVLQADGLRQKRPLRLEPKGKSRDSISTIGFQEFDKVCLSRPLEGVLGNQVILQSKQGTERVCAWDLEIIDDYFLKPGYSGSPVISQESGYVLGIVSHRQGKGQKGLAISIAALEKIWRMIDSQELYRLLLKLGYRQQVRQFRKLVKSHSIAALLICGEPDYGQRWLLNRLVTQHLPNNLMGKTVNIDLARRGRRSDPEAIWRNLARRVGLKGTPSVDSIVHRIYRWWETQDVLLVFHDVDYLPQHCFQEFLDQFWLPLATQAKESHNIHESGYKLLMFLVDYTNKVETWDTPFIEKIDSTWESKVPIRTPRLEEFSSDELFDWIEDRLDELPTSFKNEEILVQEILSDSNEGIPELVLQEICERCGVDWYEEMDRWLKL